MIKIGMLVGALFYLSNSLSAQVSLRWDKIIESSQDVQLNDISTTEDGGCLIAAYSIATDGIMTGNHGSTDTYIAKYDSQGELVWDYVFGGSQGDNLSSLSTTKQGDYILVGRSSSSDGDLVGNPDVSISRSLMVKMSDSGELVWVNVFDEDLNTLAVKIDNEDNIYTVSASGNLATSTITITKFDNDGSELWNDGVEVPGSIAFGDIAVDEEGNVYRANTLFVGDDTSQLMITKFDSDGNELWMKNYGGNDTEFGGGLVVYNNSLLLVGNTNSSSGMIVSKNDDIDAFVATIDFDGNLISSVTLGGVGIDRITDIQIDNGNILIAGTSQSSDGDFDVPYPGSTDTFIGELDDEGNLLWIEYSGGSDSEYRINISMVSDSTMVLSYTSRSQDGSLEGANDEIGGYLAYYDYNDIVSTNDLTDVDMVIYPNPASEKIIISIEDYHNVGVKIYSLAGVLLMNIDHLESNEIDICNLPSGLLKVSLCKNGRVVNSKSIFKD